jgi:hypothetical protein
VRFSLSVGLLVLQEAFLAFLVQLVGSDRGGHYDTPPCVLCSVFTRRKSFAFFVYFAYGFFFFV